MPSLRSAAHDGDMCRSVLLLLALLSFPGVHAQEVAGVRLPTVAEVGGQPLPLRGADLLRWKWVVKIYVAALYMPATAEGSCSE